MRSNLRTTSLVFLAFFLCALARPASAWDAVGHRQIADIAWGRLSKHAKTEITEILMNGDPKFRPTGATEEEAREAFRKSATFPDVIKSDRTTVYEPIIPQMNARFFQSAPANPDDKEAVLCKTWHYYDTPIRGQGHAVRQSNALNALNLARQELSHLEKSPVRDRNVQFWWLAWIEHLVGDLHQPLHCVSSYEFLPEGDAGGNLFSIVDAGRPDGRGRLHGFWDAGIGGAIGADRIQGQSPNVEDVSARWSTDRALKPSRTEVANLKVADWIREGARRADTIVYTGIQRNSAPGEDYTGRTAQVSRRMAVLAGFRLAALLNSMFDR